MEGSEVQGRRRQDSWTATKPEWCWSVFIKSKPRPFMSATKIFFFDPVKKHKVSFIIIYCGRKRVSIWKQKVVKTVSHCLTFWLFEANIYLQLLYSLSPFNATYGHGEREVVKISVTKYLCHHIEFHTFFTYLLLTMENPLLSSR